MKNHILLFGVAVLLLIPVGVNDTKPSPSIALEKIANQGNTKVGHQSTEDFELFPALASSHTYLRANTALRSSQYFKDFVREVAVNGEIFKHLLGTDKSGRAQPFCRLVDGCSGTFVTVNGKLYVATALHCINGKDKYEIEAYADGKLVQVVSSQIAKLSNADDIALLRVDERQFQVLPRSLELGTAQPKYNDIVIVGGAWAGSGIPSWNPGSKNTAIRVLRVGQQVRRHHWELQDAAWPGASGGGILSSDGKLIGVMSTTDSRGISTFASTSALQSNGSEFGNSTTGTQLFLVTRQGCSPCTQQKRELDLIEASYEMLDYRQARQRGWVIEQVPTLIAADGTRAKAYLVGATTGDDLSEWLTRYAPNATPNNNNCEEGICPVPDNGLDEVKPDSQVLLWLVIASLIAYEVRRRYQKK